MSNPIILSDNIFDDAGSAITATSEASGFPIENIIDWKTYTIWKATTSGNQEIDIDLGGGNTATPTHLLIVNHNLGTVSARIRVKYSNDDWVTEIEDALDINPQADDLMILVSLDTIVDRRWWKIFLTGMTGAPFTGVVLLGSAMQFPNPPKSKVVFKDEFPIMESSRSKGGAHLATVKLGTMLRLKARIPFLDDGWWEANVDLWWDSHAGNGKPFGFGWDLTNKPKMVYWAKMRDRYRFKKIQTVGSHVDYLELDMEALKEE